jgi:hypothetical protein
VAAEQRDELAPFHTLAYAASDMISITSRTNRAGAHNGHQALDSFQIYT